MLNGVRKATSSGPSRRQRPHQCGSASLAKRRPLTNDSNRMDADDLMPPPGNDHVSPQRERASRGAAMILCASADHAEAVAGGILALHQSIL
jgi:hypothetical protein